MTVLLHFTNIAIYINISVTELLSSNELFSLCSEHHTSAKNVIQSEVFLNFKNTWEF